jgi:two-component system, OmpR family, response regulator
VLLAANSMVWRTPQAVAFATHYACAWLGVAVVAGERVLLVEDDEQLRGVVSEVLGLAGYEVYPAASVEEGRAALAAWPPHWVLLDLHGAGDPTVIARAASGLPLVLTSGSDTQYLAAACQRLGAAAFLRKPYDLEELLSTLAALRVSTATIDPGGTSCCASSA